MVRQRYELQQGVSKELARGPTKPICDYFPKLKSQIQGDAVRVTGQSKDELQAVMAALRENDYPVPLQFIQCRQAPPSLQKYLPWGTPSAEKKVEGYQVLH